MKNGVIFFVKKAKLRRNLTEIFGIFCIRKKKSFYTKNRHENISFFKKKNA